jgi:arginyl-tRNA synthetase
MNSLIDVISAEVSAAFEKAGYSGKYGKVTESNRPDLCEFQCNGAMAAKKEYNKIPRDIASDVAGALLDSKIIDNAEVAGPGFLNIKISNDFLADYLQNMNEDDHLGVDKVKNPKTVIIDYGGPNVAKPLHVGHLRSAIIGESIKRLGRFMGDKMIGDVHLGDWGLQMGLIISEIQERQPDLPYFDPDFEGEYPEEAPFTISELEEIYPTASGKSKVDEEFKNKALQATHELQLGRRGYIALWNHIMNVSVNDLKANYKKLNVEFDLWKKESDAQPYIPDMVQMMKDKGYAYEDNGALIVDVKEDTDKKEVPPCIILKSDGASLYTTTDLATIVEREKLFKPDKLLYVVDKRQEMHFIQVFRCAKKTGLVPENVEMQHLGFGTMNGKDGKPFKTRDGGVMRLENLIAEINEQMYNKIVENKAGADFDKAEIEETSKIVGLAAIKYGDLSNQATKDYIFDPDRFTSFEGNTGPYILYTIVRIKSILERFKAAGGNVEECRIKAPVSESEKSLMLQTAAFNPAITNAYEETAPHKICAYIYALSNELNHFYHETKILSEEDETKKSSWIALLNLVLKVLEQSIDVLGFEAPERM